MSISELLAKFDIKPTSSAELLQRRTDLIQLFKEQHGLSTWDEIEAEVRDLRIPETELVERWIDLRAALDVMGLLDK